MKHNPSKIKFEAKADLIDYVSKGGIPNKTYFESFIKGVQYPMPEGINDDDVKVSDNIIDTNERPIIADVLTKVYKNRVGNRRKAIIGIATVAIIGSLVKQFLKKD